MKKPFLFLLLACSWAAQAQITSYNNAAQNDFYGIGGYAFTQTTFPNGVQTNPYVITGPSPQNDFICVVSATGGIINVGSSISTATINTPITIQFKGNNVRKFGCRVFASLFGGGGTTSDVVQLTATTNLGNTASMNGSTASLFVGFRVMGANEYLTSIQATFTSPVAVTIALRNIIVGDDQAQNVSLNFDGVDDNVSTNANVGNFATNQDFTVTCWVKPDLTQVPQGGQNPDENDIISKWAGLGAGANNNYPFVIRYLNSTRFTVAERGKILVGQWDGTSFPLIISTTAVNDGRWHHVAFVRESGVFKLYIDGNLEGSVADNAVNSTSNTTPLQFGRRGNNESYFKGEIDEVRIWSIAKTAPQVSDERFCKTPNATNLVAFYNFNNGVPNGTNTLISQVNEASNSANNGTLNNFAKTGDASNFVTGQVKYVKMYDQFGFQNGSSWANGYYYLQDALTNNTCNDLIEIYVSRGFDRPDLPNNRDDNSRFYSIPVGMKIYGGFAGTEKNINERNMALINTTNETILGGDLGSNDTPFDFALNRADNSIKIVQIDGNGVVFDGFTVRGIGYIEGVGTNSGIYITGTNSTIKNSLVIDNAYVGMWITNSNVNITNCSMMGNGDDGIYMTNSPVTIKECLIANNGLHGIEQSGPGTTTIINCTIAANATYGIRSGQSNNIIKNTIINGNGSTGISIIGVGTSFTITNSLVQGNTGGTNGNLNGNTVNPQFVSPLANTVRSDAGNYRLKWCSLAIGAGNNTGISPLDLDRNPRLYRTNVDMGAYEHMGNTPTGANPIDITYTIDIPNYSGVGVQRITSATKILAPAGTVNFNAPNSITLNPGFEARGIGKYFKAEIGANVACSN